MKRIISSLAISAAIVYLSGCLSESNAESNDFLDIDFVISSKGSQSDTHGGQSIETNNEVQFNNLLNTIPSISGAYPTPNWDKNEVVTILSKISVCASLEVTSVKENFETRLITLTKVFTSEPGLCDPAPIAFQSNEYVMVELLRSSKPISIMYTARNDY